MNIGKNPAVVVKRYYDDGKITQKELVQWGVDCLKQDPKYLNCRAFELGCNSRQDIITKLVPQHILDCYNWNNGGLAKARRRVDKIYATSEKGKGKSHLKKMKVVLDHQRDYTRTRLLFFHEELSFNNVAIKDIEDANSGILYQKKKIVNLRLCDMFGHNNERIINASARTVSRNLDEFYGFIIYARRNIASKNDPTLPDPVKADDKRWRYLIKTRKVPGLYFNHEKYRYEEDLASKHDLNDDVLEERKHFTEDDFRLYGHPNRHIQISPGAREQIIKLRRQKTNDIKAKLAEKPTFILLYESMFGKIDIKPDLDWGWESEK